MNIMIVGYGSAGARHADLLREAGHELTVVTKNPLCPYPDKERFIEEAMGKKVYDAVLVAVPTCTHLDVLTTLRERGFSGPILVEKPLFSELPLSSASHLGNGIHVAYNLRFHPLLQRVKELLQSRHIFSMLAYVGQYLPQWREGRDYRSCYSASKEKGGGALRDLSHELDYLQWLSSPWQSVTAAGGHFSSLEISSDDLYTLIWRDYLGSVIHAELNYLDMTPGGRRELFINAEGLSLKVDMRAGSLSVNGEKAEQVKLPRNVTYRAQLATWLGGEAQKSNLCTYSEGLDTVTLIAAAETAATENRWVNR